MIMSLEFILNWKDIELIAKLIIMLLMNDILNP